jgi:hypothetical protein
MKYLEPRTIEALGLDRPLKARPRRFIWLVWMQPHLRDGVPRTATRTQLRWPVYLRHGGC